MIINKTLTITFTLHLQYCTIISLNRNHKTQLFVAQILCNRNVLRSVVTETDRSPHRTGTI